MTKKKCLKVLFIAPSPPNHLNRIRALNIIRSFKELWHSVFLVSLYKTKKEQESLNAMLKEVDDSIWIYQPFWRSLICSFIGLFLPIPLRVAYCFSPKLHIVLNRLHKIHHFDLVYIKRLRMAQYAGIFWLSAFIDITDSMTKYYDNLLKVSKSIFQKALCFEEFFKHKKYETKICNQFSNIIICSESDREYLVANGVTRENFYVLRNWIQSNDRYFKFNPINKQGIINLVFWWVMNVDTNILSMDYFINKIFPLLPKNYKLTIIWPKPPKTLTDLATDRIIFLWHIDDLRKAVLNFHIFVCPIVSWAWTKNKILQAWSAGLPIIATTLGLDWLSDELVNKLEYADTINSFIEWILRISTMNQESLKKSVLCISETINNTYNVTTMIQEFLDTKMKNE